MEIWISAWFLKTLEFMGVTIGGLFVAALVLFVVIWDHRSAKKKISEQDAKIHRLYELTRRVERVHAAQDKRIDMHAQHFDVLDKDTDRAKNHAHKALSLCFKIVSDLSNPN